VHDGVNGHDEKLSGLLKREEVERRETKQCDKNKVKYKGKNTRRIRKVKVVNRERRRETIRKGCWVRNE
jgi:hypothetical protein